MINLTKPTFEISELLQIRHRVQQEKPLIHCITHPIVIKDCANALLSISARPIMAEYPPEVAHITKQAQALSINLGNINAVRMQAMMLSGKAALEDNIPCVLDAVGVACSEPRLLFAHDFIRECRPCIIKGNSSELKALSGLKSHAKGVDAGEQDRIHEDTLEEHIAALHQLSIDTGAVIACTGAIDIVTNGTTAAILKNGCESMSLLTGTGCMLGAITAGFLSAGDPFAAAILAISYLNICGELAQEGQPGPASFFLRFMDFLYLITDQQLEDAIHITIQKGRTQHA